MNLKENLIELLGGVTKEEHKSGANTNTIMGRYLLIKKC